MRQLTGGSDALEILHRHTQRRAGAHTPAVEQRREPLLAVLIQPALMLSA